MLPLRAVGSYRETVSTLSDVRMSMACNTYAEHKMALRKWRPSSLKVFRAEVTGWLSILEDKNVRQITTEDVERLWLSLASSGCSPRWVERSRIDFQGVFKWLLKHRAISEDPSVIWERTEIDEEDHLRVFHDWTYEELQRLTEKAPPAVWLFVWTACFTGLRRGNIFAARRSWLSPDWILTIPSTEFKQRRSHKIPIHPALQNLLATSPLGRPEEPLIPGLPSCPSCINKILRKLAKDAGLNPAWSHPHNFRRTFCAWLKAAGVSREEAMELLGSHSESVLIKHYWPRTTDAERRNSIEKL